MSVSGLGIFLNVNTGLLLRCVIWMDDCWCLSALLITVIMFSSFNHLPLRWCQNDYELSWTTLSSELLSGGNHLPFYVNWIPLVYSNCFCLSASCSGGVMSESCLCTHAINLRRSEFKFAQWRPCLGQEWGQCSFITLHTLLSINSFQSVGVISLNLFLKFP